MQDTKVIRFDAIQQWARANKDKIVVAASGCFDGLHRGHVTYLKKAREYGHVLIVGVNSDASVKQVKGESRPIHSQEDRAFMLAALECVDAVVIFNELNAAAFLAAAQPEIWAKGDDYSLETLHADEIAAVRKHGGAIGFIPRVLGFSTTQSIADKKI